jgi:molecular chaperone DnaK
VSSIESVLKDAKTALEEGTAERMEKAHEQLTQASHKVAAALYQSSSANDAAPGGPQTDSSEGGSGATADDDDVIDAEYVDVDAEQSS